VCLFELGYLLADRRRSLPTTTDEISWNTDGWGCHQSHHQVSTIYFLTNYFIMFMIYYLCYIFKPTSTSRVQHSVIWTYFICIKSFYWSLINSYLFIYLFIYLVIYLYILINSRLSCRQQTAHRSSNRTSSPSIHEPVQ
jgi:hypothetical protein